MKALSAAFVIASLLLVGMLGAEINEVTIYDIQYTTDPSGTSPLLGDTVITYGIVTGIFGNSFFIEERPGGAWHGIYVYRGYQSSPAVSEGDSVRVLGIVSEYYNLTEIGTNYYGEVEIIASGLSLPDTTEITVAQMWSEQYEGMLARINTVHFVETGTFNVKNWGSAGLVYLTNFLFSAGPCPPSFWNSDVNGDGWVDYRDLIYLASYLYESGPEPVCQRGR